MKKGILSFINISHVLKTIVGVRQLSTNCISFISNLSETLFIKFRQSLSCLDSSLSQSPVAT